MFRKRYLTIGIVSIIVIAIATVFATSIIKNDTIQVYTSPQNATIKVGDTTITSGKPAHINPGTYPLSISADNFTSIRRDIIITSTLQSFSFCLIPTNMDQGSYLSTHEEDRYICEGAAGQAYNEEAEAAIKKYPIIGDLPYEDGTFSIGQGILESGGGPAIYVHYSSERSQTEAKQWLSRYPASQIPTVIYTNDYEQLDRIGGKGSELDKILIQKYPIIKTLPTNAYIYKLGYKIDQSDKSGHSIKLTIIADTPSGRIAALREISALGYNPTDYKIEFINFESDVK